MEMIERAEDHRSITCTACGASGAEQYRHDTGRMLGLGRFELRCRCGHVTRYDIGCSRLIHERAKATVATFLAATINHEYTVDCGLIWALCPLCGSTVARHIVAADLPDGGARAIQALAA